ncbi:DUF2589 domain-containing protein [Dyella tabacisoli]|uniref:DUF2589 domain-containing protein n=1 Tax=Dyella tabacisoli TaxID=2282381 RepID=A0A369UTQ9_9GAMM|nr:DUF2589 domain-containing protein [Dyella tabacisoli]RDD83435.1 DUF2589 domain-containing protein [Dyella tabacisoli]
MATSLNDLIKALAGAVIEAQDRVTQHQTALLRDYFDADNRPHSVTIRLPSAHPQADENDEDLYRVPLLSLVSTNVLHIKDVEISFDADLGEMTEQAPPPGDNGAAPAANWTAHPSSPRTIVGIDTQAATAGRRQGSVHVVMRVEGAEPTDGAARLINHLAQSQGVFKTIKVS